MSIFCLNCPIIVLIQKLPEGATGGAALEDTRGYGESPYAQDDAGSSDDVHHDKARGHKG